MHADCRRISRSPTWGPGEAVEPAAAAVDVHFTWIPAGWSRRIDGGSARSRPDPRTGPPHRATAARGRATGSAPRPARAGRARAPPQGRAWRAAGYTSVSSAPMPKPSTVTRPTHDPASSKASGIIVSASIVSTAPAAKAWIVPITTAGAEASAP